MSFEHLSAQLSAQHAKHGFRQTKDVIGGNSTHMTFSDQHFVNFSSNDYLGLATEPLVIQACHQAANKYGVGSAGSSLVTGHSALHQRLQSLICDITGLESCLLFNSGFAANCGVIATLLTRDDILLQDKLNHASLMEAGMQSPATMKRFAHNDINKLEQHLLNTRDKKNKLVVSEGVFSMDGDRGDLSALSKSVAAHKAWLMVDDAHGFGVNGAGCGSCVDASITPDILMATFGKAIGTSGAFVAATSQTVDYLTNFCRHYVYSTAMPIPVVGATIKSIELSQQIWRHDKLAERIAHFKHQVQTTGLALMPSHSAIQPIIIGSSEDTLKMSDYLKRQGQWVTAIRPPTVPQHSARLRITLSSNHTLDEIDMLIVHLNQAMDLLQKGAL